MFGYSIFRICQALSEPLKHETVVKYRHNTIQKKSSKLHPNKLHKQAALLAVKQHKDSKYCYSAFK